MQCVDESVGSAAWLEHGLSKEAWWLFLIIEMEARGHPGVLFVPCLGRYVCVYRVAFLGCKKLVYMKFRDGTLL